MTTQFNFKKIALVGRRRVDDIPATLASLIEYLQSLGMAVILETETAALIDHHKLPVVAAHKLGQHAELIIAVGGDGSLIHAAHIAMSQKLPVLGINRGRLGFLTDIYPDEIQKIAAILQGHCQAEQRSVLRASFSSDGQNCAEIAVNDVVLFASDVAHMIEFEIYLNQQFVCSQRADGLILATPTGSTAYAMSGGGPIIQPTLDAIVLVPMFPHTLSNRPIVVPDSSVIDIVINKHNEHSSFLSCDGRARFRVQAGHTIRISKNAEQLHLIHPDDYNYFATLREKLGWHHSRTGSIGLGKKEC